MRPGRGPRAGPAGVAGAAAFAVVSVVLVTIGPGSSGAHSGGAVVTSPVAAERAVADTVADALELDAGQRAAWEPLRTEHCVARAQLVAEGARLRRRIHGEDDGREAAETPAIGDVEAHRQRVLGQRHAFEAKIDALLTAEQRVVFNRSREALVWVACP